MVRRSANGRLSPVLVLLLASGCTTVVHPPADVAEPARAALLDHGRHASLVVEDPDGGMVRYAYGDWGWFALRDTGAVEATRAVLWPTHGALGRARLPGPLTPESLASSLRIEVVDALYVEVEAAAARRLVDRLDGIFRENADTRVYNAAYDLEFVQYRDDYWVMRNSNRMVAQWLEELGCEIDGPAVLSLWELAGEPEA